MISEFRCIRRYVDEFCVLNARDVMIDRCCARRLRCWRVATTSGRREVKPKRSEICWKGESRGGPSYKQKDEKNVCAIVRLPALLERRIHSNLTLGLRSYLGYGFVSKDSENASAVYKTPYNFKKTYDHTKLRYNLSGLRGVTNLRCRNYTKGRGREPSPSV